MGLFTSNAHAKILVTLLPEPVGALAEIPQNTPTTLN